MWNGCNQKPNGSYRNSFFLSNMEKKGGNCRLLLYKIRLSWDERKRSPVSSCGDVLLSTRGRMGHGSINDADAAGQHHQKIQSSSLFFKLMKSKMKFHFFYKKKQVKLLLLFFYPRETSWLLTHGVRRLEVFWWSELVHGGILILFIWTVTTVVGALVFSPRKRGTC